MSQGKLTSPAIALLLLSLAPLSAPTPAGAASEEESTFLAMYFSPDELEIFSATRSLKSVAKIAENVAVVTADDIETMNAHTAAEALYNVTGVEMEAFKGPGSGGYASIHGSGKSRVTVMLDGVPLQTAQNDFHLAALPVQMIEKIEVIKGPASATWGSSFGGLINVITKSAPAGSRLGGMVSASYGGKDTSDARVELSGRKNGLGMYLYGGRTDSDGVQDSHEFTHENFFSKVNLEAGRRTNIDLSLYYHNSDSVSADFPPRGTREGFALETLLGKAELRKSFTDDVDLNLSGWWNRQHDTLYEGQVSTGESTRTMPTLYDRLGLSGSLAWRAGDHSFVAGADVSNSAFEHEFEPSLSIDQDKHAVFVNDTIVTGSFHITPGLRYDHSSLAGGLASPSLGATYLASRNLLFRTLVSRGFHDPMIVRYYDAPPVGYVGNKALKPEKIWSYQAGAEANVSDLFRAKLTLFYHDIDDIMVEKTVDQQTHTFTTENAGRARTAGGEFEIATNTFKSFVLKAGAHYERTKRLDYSESEYFDTRDVYGFNASLAYKGDKGLRSELKAHYLWWDMTDYWASESNGVVVDFTIDRRFFATSRITLAPFFSAHNIFNAASYDDQFHQNPQRWLEAGLRCSF